MQKLKRMTILAFVLSFIFSMAIPSMAKEVVDRSKVGSISIVMKYGESYVGGGNFTLYRVGDIAHDNGDYSFAPGGDFATCGADFSDITDKELASNLAQFAKANGIAPMETQQISGAGEVAFRDLELGLYMLVQTKAAPHFSVVKPFLVSVPYFENDIYLYDVNASPKVDLVPAPPTVTTTPTPTLPQTGQENWPVPLLAVSGLMLFTLGWVLRYGRKNEE